MNQDLTFTVLELAESAARLPDLASTAEAMVEVAVDDGIFRHSEHYPHYHHYAIVPPRPVLTYRKSSAGSQWEFSGRIKLLAYEMREAEEKGLKAWLSAKLGPRCANVDIGAPEGSIIPIRVLIHGARTEAPEVISGTYANNSEEARHNPWRDRGAAPVKDPRA